ncbi:MAG: hypothetical protein JWR14_3994 [Caballeronia sp.]|jgi:hypothetical protein|uniref:hypothetical protein n=1 Tax=Caballeronia sp. TaxID=1931223 RepID=UPI00262D6E8F|nr:hypothetical protein [Caballeronia sp.]MDB5834164.1 hypothetical protein [Caballeronia sp.]
MAMRNMYRLRDKVANTSHERVFRICDECFRVCTDVAGACRWPEWSIIARLSISPKARKSLEDAVLLVPMMQAAALGSTKNR